MEDVTIELCRFCLKTVIEHDFQEIGEATIKFLDVLRLKPNLDITRRSIICNNCAEDFRKAFEFKSTYTYTTELTARSISVEDGMKLKMGEHFLFEKEEIDLNSDMRGKITCRVCAKFLFSNCLVPSYEVEDYLIFANHILVKYVPELVSHLTNENTICRTCFDSVKCYVRLVEKCWGTEKKINEYCVAEGINNNGQVDLKSVLEFSLKQILKQETYSSEEAKIKVEIRDDDAADTDVINENTIKLGVPDMATSYEETKVKLEPWESASFTPPQEILWVKSETDTNDIEITKKYVCKTCFYQTDDKKSLGRHNILHNPSDIKFYCCELCTYKTRRKELLGSHRRKHAKKEKKVYKCHLCIFQAQYKSILRKHMVVHTDPSLLKLFTCHICSYQTKYKGSLNGHMQKHNEEVSKCDVCGFETKYKKNLERHMVVHKDPAEMPKYKCAICPFEARRKGHLSTHIMIKHRGALELPRFKCETCGFEFIAKSDFNRHNNTVHKDPSEITMYKCDVCSFQTKYKDHIPRHMIKHKDPSEVVTFKCELCPFQTKYENGMKGHLLTHADTSELPVFQCDFCSYKTKRRQYLNRHMGSHKKLYMFESA